VSNMPDVAWQKMTAGARHRLCLLEWLFTPKKRALSL
jgi:hypothetical protein